MDNLIIFCAQYLVVAVVLALGIVWLRASKSDKLRLLAAVVLTGVVSLVLSRIAGKLYFDPRPFVSHHVKPLIPHGPDNGFPSDHALFTMTLTTAAYYFSKRVAAGMLVATVLVGVARVLADVHSPIDIAGGWVIGIVGGLAGYHASRFLLAGLRQRTATSKPESDKH